MAGMMRRVYFFLINLFAIFGFIAVILFSYMYWPFNKFDTSNFDTAEMVDLSPIDEMEAKYYSIIRIRGFDCPRVTGLFVRKENIDGYFVHKIICQEEETSKNKFYQEYYMYYIAGSLEQIPSVVPID